jgi:hypothetical protein
MTRTNTCASAGALGDGDGLTEVDACGKAIRLVGSLVAAGEGCVFVPAQPLAMTAANTAARDGRIGFDCLKRNGP